MFDDVENNMSIVSANIWLISWNVLFVVVLSLFPALKNKYILILWIIGIVPVWLLGKKLRE